MRSQRCYQIWMIDRKNHKIWPNVCRCQAQSMLLKSLDDKVNKNFFHFLFCWYWKSSAHWFKNRERLHLVIVVSTNIQYKHWWQQQQYRIYILIYGLFLCQQFQEVVVQSLNIAFTCNYPYFYARWEWKKKKHQQKNKNYHRHATNSFLIYVCCCENC